MLMEQSHFKDHSFLCQRENILEDVEFVNNAPVHISLASDSVMAPLRYDRDRNSIFMSPEGKDNWILGSYPKNYHRTP